MECKKENGYNILKKFRTAIIGIAMIVVPYLLGTLEFVQELLDGAGFFCGLLNGIFLLALMPLSPTMEPAL